jgi:hypothetical protein
MNIHVRLFAILRERRTRRSDRVDAGADGSQPRVRHLATQLMVARLDYEAYREMVEARMARILEGCVERHGLLGVAAEHRIGPVPLDEPAVIVAVSAGRLGAPGMRSTG